MDAFMQQRRRLLLSTAAWAGGCAAFAASNPVRAFQVQEMSPGSAVGRAFAERCGGSPEHVALTARLQALLADDPTAQSISETCAICGCPVVVSR